VEAIPVVVIAKVATLVVVLVIVVNPALTKAFTLNKVGSRLFVLLDDHAFERAFYRLSARRLSAR
jgi:hypothetical protein